MTNDMIAMISKWEERLRPLKCDKKDDPQVWVISFSHLITITEKEKKLNPKAMITHKRPKTIGPIPTNYKHLVLSKTREPVKGESGPCGHCALCGCYGKHSKSMVLRVSQIMSKTKTFLLNQNLTCANYGIHVATSVLCHEQYVGQTKNKFSMRWSAHRSSWYRPICKNDKNEKVACRGTMFCFMVTQINQLCMKLTSSLLLNNQIFTP